MTTDKPDDEATTDLTAVLAAWFTENLTFDRFREWSDEDFATRLADALAPVIRAERAAAVEGAAELAIGCEHGDDLTWCAACDEWHSALRRRAQAERRGEPNG